MEIEGYEDYTIDRDGNVWSKKTNIFMKPRVNGYLYVGVCKNGKEKIFTLHRLLAMAYIPNPENKPEVDHKDRNTFNNSLSNLRWATREEQMENRGNWGEIKHKLICYSYDKKNDNKYYKIRKEGYFQKYLNVDKYTLKDAVDLRRSLLMFHKLPPIPQDE
mgnify:CR=1 FL=1|tara:strand:- start:41 stop:523 length:483 start_codon:yes stop_codon:yes gene_type:complete